MGRALRIGCEQDPLPASMHVVSFMNVGRCEVPPGFRPNFLSSGSRCSAVHPVARTRHRGGPRIRRGGRGPSMPLCVTGLRGA